MYSTGKIDKNTKMEVNLYDNIEKKMYNTVTKIYNKFTKQKFESVPPIMY
jgi:hypothetical protein